MRGALIIGGVGLIFAAVAFLGASLQEDRYTAETALVFRGRTFAESIPGAIRQASAETAPSPATTEALLSLPVIAERTAGDLPGNLSGGEIADKVDLQMHPGSELLTLRVTDPNPNSAAAIANAYAEEAVTLYRSADREIVRSATKGVGGGTEGNLPPGRSEQVERILRHLHGRLHTLEVLQVGDLEQVEPAAPPGSPSSPNVGTDVLFGLLIGICVGSALVAIGDARGRIDDAGRLMTEVAAPLIGAFTEVAVSSHLRDVGTDPVKLPAQPIDMLWARIRYYEPKEDRRVLLVTSAAAAEGRSTVSRSLVGAANAAGVKSTLIEADHVGAGIGRLLDELEADGYELVVVDGRASSRGGDLAAIPEGVDGVIVIGRIGLARVRGIRVLREEARAAHTPVLGVVANFASPQDPQAKPFVEHRAKSPTATAVA